MIPSVECAHSALVDIVELVPNPRNPNRHPKKQIELLAKIIKSQGWRNPIVVSNRSGFVVKGHARLEAAKILGLGMVPVDRQNYESEAQEWADMIADNRIAELAEPDLPSLKDLLEELDTGSFDMDLTGFDTKALEDLMTQTFQPKEAEGQTMNEGLDYRIMVFCGSESEQGLLLNRFEGEGLKCQPLIL